MAWTAPRNWSDISDDIVTAAMLNTDVRDNLLFLGGTSDVTTGHTHTGAAGMGAASMSGLTLTALVNLTFTDEGVPDAAGELQRHGNDLKWYGASVVNLTAADQSAGTASLRSLNTTSTTAAAGNHTHIPTSAASGSSKASATVSSSETDVVTHSATPGAAGRSWAIFAAGHARDSGDTYTYKLYFGTTLLATVTDITGAGLDANIAGLSGLQENPAVSSHTIKMTAQRTAGAGDNAVDAVVFFREVEA
jgi:hypothetical protein